MGVPLELQFNFLNFSCMILFEVALPVNQLKSLQHEAEILSNI